MICRQNNMGGLSSMVHLALALVAILVELSPPASGFGIVSYQPRDNVVEAKVGDSVRLECVADSVLKRCAWFHVDTRTGCELGYSHETSGFVKRRCFVANHTERVFVVGVYEKNECAIRIDNITLVDTGTWKCDVQEYVHVLNFFKSAGRVQHVFQLNITGRDDPKNSEANVVGPKIDLAEAVEYEGGDQFPLQDSMLDDEALVDDDDVDDGYGKLRPLMIFAVICGVVAIAVAGAIGGYCTWKKCEERRKLIELRYDSVKLTEVIEEPALSTDPTTVEAASVPAKFGNLQYPTDF